FPSTTLFRSCDWGGIVTHIGQGLNDHNYICKLKEGVRVCVLVCVYVCVCVCVSRCVLVCVCVCVCVCVWCVCVCVVCVCVCVCWSVVCPPIHAAPEEDSVWRRHLL